MPDLIARAIDVKIDKEITEHTARFNDLVARKDELLEPDKILLEESRIKIETLNELKGL